MDYHRVRRSVPDQAAGFAPVTLEDAARHRDGLSCRNPASYVYDANGRGRWCIDCNAPLGEEAAWHPNGADLSIRALGVTILVAALLVGVMCWLLVGMNAQKGDVPGPRSTPTTYGAPATCDRVTGC